jgi:Flp pilus assembly protein TadG
MYFVEVNDMIRTLRRLIESRSGNFGLLFAFTAVPIIFAMGCGVDFSYALTAKRQLQQAADSAAVSALAEQSVGVIAALKAGTIGDVDVGKADAKAIFNANLDPKFASYITSYDATVKRTATQFTSQVTFTAKIPTSFLGIVGKRSIIISGSAQGSYVPATYVDFYLMLDNSPSMGLGATTADITTLQNATKNMSHDANCAFACHDTSHNSSTSDYYTLAKSLTFTSRIQVVAKAAQAMMTTATSTRKYSDQYRMSVYSMGTDAASEKLTNVAPLSSDLSTVSSKTATVDVMTIAGNNYNSDQQTDLLSNLKSLKNIIDKGGSGINATDPQKVLFLVSDGVEDANRPSGCLKKLSGSTRCQQPIDSKICDQIKANGVRIAVLYTTYQPITANSWYNSWIKPFSAEISPAMKACASPDLFFEVSPSDGITEAMNALFLKIVNLPKLTG